MINLYKAIKLEFINLKINNLNIFKFIIYTEINLIFTANTVMLLIANTQRFSTKH